MIKRIKPGHLIIWHRRAGLAAVLFVLLLAISGVMLNHTSALGLDKQPIASRVLLEWYGVKVPAQLRHFGVDDRVVSQLGEQLFLDAKPLAKNPHPLLGVTANRTCITLAFENGLMLFTLNGELLEQITNLPAQISPIDAIGSDASGHVALRHDNAIVIADNDLLEWSSMRKTPPLFWSQPLMVEESYEETIISSYHNHDLTYERLLLDLHSGRLFGKWGPYLMDLAAAIMILLALTGLWRRLQGMNFTHKTVRGDKDETFE